MKNINKKRTNVYLTLKEISFLQNISNCIKVKGKRNRGISGAITYLVDYYRNSTSSEESEDVVDYKPTTLIENSNVKFNAEYSKDEEKDNELTEDEIITLSNINEDEIPTKNVEFSLDDILNEWIKLPFALNLNGYPKELVYSEAKIIRDQMGKRLLQEISMEISKVKQLRKYKEVNDRIESGNAQEGDFNPEIHSSYSALRSNIMDGRSSIIYPLATFVHHFNCIVNNSKKHYVEDYTVSIDDIPECPFTQFKENIEELITSSVIEFDPEIMFDAILDTEVYNEHIIKLGKIAKNL